MSSSNSPTYRSWKLMHRRCYGSSDQSAYYKDRGISVCDAWHDFGQFLADLGPRPAGMTLDRIDPNSGYSPENCRWATVTEQARNKRNNVVLTLNGESACITEWAERIGVDRNTIRARIKKGWPIEQVLRDKSVRHHINGRTGKSK